VLRGELPEAYGRWPAFCQAQYLETAYLLPGYILSSQGDRVAMAHSVEGRFPFLDHRVVDFAASLPPRLKMRGLQEKFLLKETARGLVPEPILRRPKQPYRAPDVPSFFLKGGQGSDLGYVRDLLSPQALEDFGLFDPRAVSALVRKCEKGRFLGVKDNMAFVLRGGAFHAAGGGPVHPERGGSRFAAVGGGPRTRGRLTGGEERSRMPAGQELVEKGS
jgi:asparagine synthase (glutamine-hydrolysing)